MTKQSTGLPRRLRLLAVTSLAATAEPSGLSKTSAARVFRFPILLDFAVNSKVKTRREAAFESLEGEAEDVVSTAGLLRRLRLLAMT